MTAALPIALRPAPICNARTSPRRTPRQKRAEETVAILLDATELVVARQGPKAATTNRIAHVAGTSIGTLYHYFPSKEALIEAVVHRMWTRELATFEEHLEGLLDGPMAAAIQQSVAAMVALMAKSQELYKRWYSEAPHLGQVELGLEKAEQAGHLLRGMLERRRAEVRPTNLDFAADFVVKTCLAVVRIASRDYPREIRSGELTEELSQMMARYLLKSVLE